MKKIILFILFLTFQLQANEITKNYSFDSFETAKKDANHLFFEGKSTKFGMVTTKWEGAVKQFTIKADREGFQLKNIEVTFPIESMDTDSNSRDEKMQMTCLGAKDYKEITVKINGMIKLDGTQNKFPGTITIRGKEKPIEIEISARLNDNKIISIGSAILSFKDLEIPDPSILIAKVDDTINISFSVELE